MRLPNLLPQEDKKVYKIYLGVLYLRKFLLFQATIMAVFVVVLGSYFLYLDAEGKTLKEEKEHLLEVQRNLDIKGLQDVADSHNEQLKAAAALLKIKPELSIYIDEVARLVPEGVTLDTVDLSATTYILDVKGRAARREQVVLFQQRLENSEILELAFAPLSNLTESQDAVFQFILKGKK